MTFHQKTLYNHQKGLYMMLTNKICLDKIEGVELSVFLSEYDKNTPFTHREIHMHEEYELLVNLKGEKLLELSGKLCVFPKNSIAVVKPYEGHRCLFHSEGRHSYFWILLKTDDSFMDALFEEDESGSIIRPEKGGVEELTRWLHMLSEGRMSGFEKYVAFFTMLDIIKKGKAVELSEEKVTIPKDVVLALEYMEKHIAEKFTVDDIAKASHVSINTLERHFKEHLQLSPSATLKRKRLISATKLLSHNMSVSEVCERCGFTDYSSFIVSFRKFYGITPLKYQKSRQP